MLRKEQVGGRGGGRPRALCCAGGRGGEGAGGGSIKPRAVRGAGGGRGQGGAALNRMLREGQGGGGGRGWQASNLTGACNLMVMVHLLHCHQVAGTGHPVQ